MKRLLLLLLALPIIFLVSCGNSSLEQTTVATNNTFEVITASDAKDMMDNDSTIILVDVRELFEYQSEHIPGATLLPLGNIGSEAGSVLPDKSATYIIYCRSGNRSNTASQQLVDLGYESIYDMGGIIDWPYDTVSS
jgi:rhodanese-related sulfurtransferase